MEEEEEEIWVKVHLLYVLLLHSHFLYLHSTSQSNTERLHKRGKGPNIIALYNNIIMSVFRYKFIIAFTGPMGAKRRNRGWRDPI